MAFEAFAHQISSIVRLLSETAPSEAIRPNSIGPSASGRRDRSRRSGRLWQVSRHRQRYWPRLRASGWERRFQRAGLQAPCPPERKSVVEGKSVSVRVDFGGRRIINKTTHKEATTRLIYDKISD